MKAAEFYDDDEPVNLGASRELLIKELVEVIAELTGFEGIRHVTPGTRIRLDARGVGHDRFDVHDTDVVGLRNLRNGLRARRCQLSEWRLSSW